MEPTAFVVASVALLATPGPTNTLLATSGAAIGVRRSIPLLAGELCGYMAAITLLRVLVGPIVAAIPAFEILLRIAVVSYLLYLSAKLWLHGAAEISGSGPVTISLVFVTTLLNPKGIIFAFTLLPQGIDLLLLCPWLAALAVQITAIGSAWIVTGAWLRRGLRGVIPPSIGYRASSIALILLAGIVSAHAFK
jgi:threonine/homoserine/homoserine lactone efflux protein